MNFRRVRGVAAIVFFLFVIAVVIQSHGATGTEPVTGKDLFGRRCSGCHATDASKEGPRLRGVVGRKAGSVAGFQYSDEKPSKIAIAQLRDHLDRGSAD
jgi:cytochrome c